MPEWLTVKFVCIAFRKRDSDRTSNVCKHLSPCILLIGIEIPIKDKNFYYSTIVIIIPSP